MKKSILLLALLLSYIFASAQSTGVIGVSIKKGTSENWGKNKMVVTNVIAHFPADRVNIKPYDIITHVKGQAVDDLSVEQVSSMLKGEAGTEVNLTVLQLGQKLPREITLIRQAPLPENSFSEAEIIPLLSDQLYLTQTNQINDAILYNNIEKNTIRDPEATFEKYASFDFEFTNAENPIQEKQLAAIVQTALEEKGFKRDRENPDLLVFISFFSGNEKQYVPPTQKIYTRYQFGYDLWTGFGNKQYVESTTEAGYTQVTYMLNLKLAFMDAQKAKEQSKVPPIVWQSEYNATSSQEMNLQNNAEVVFKAMIRQSFPVMNPNLYILNKDNKAVPYGFSDVVEGSQKIFYYTGICYDKTIPNKVVYVYPQSPASEAGIEVGDIITSVNNRDMPATTDELITNFIYSIKKEKEKKKKFETSVLNDPKYKAGFSYIEGVYDTQKEEYAFKVSREGTSQTIYITPEKRRFTWQKDDKGESLFKVKDTPNVKFEKKNSGGFNCFVGISKLNANDEHYLSTRMATKEGTGIILDLEGILGYRWRFGDQFSFNWYEMNEFNGFKTNYYDINFCLSTKYMLLPTFYLTNEMGLTLQTYAVKDEQIDVYKEQGEGEKARFQFSLGVEERPIKGISIFGKYNMVERNRSVELGLKLRLGRWW